MEWQAAGSIPCFDVSIVGSPWLQEERMTRVLFDSALKEANHVLHVMDLQIELNINSYEYTINSLSGANRVDMPMPAAMDRHWCRIAWEGTLTRNTQRFVGVIMAIQQCSCTACLRCLCERRRDSCITYLPGTVGSSSRSLQPSIWLESFPQALPNGATKKNISEPVRVHRSNLSANKQKPVVTCFLNGNAGTPVLGRFPFLRGNAGRRVTSIYGNKSVSSFGPPPKIQRHTMEGLFPELHVRPNSADLKDAKTAQE
jgi:hypothetical protein